MSVENHSLNEFTFGQIVGIKSRVKLELSLTPEVVSQILTENRVSIPPQSGQAEVVFWNQSAMPASFDVAPVFSYYGNSLHDIQIYDAKIGIHNLRSQFLPASFCRIIENTVEMDSALRANLVGFGQSFLETLKTQFN